MLEIRKRGLTTPQAVQRICKVLGCASREAGWAGLKDAQAVTTQWISLFRIDEDRLKAAEDELGAAGIVVLQYARHPHKVRTGHLRGNRFTLLIREVPIDAVSKATQALHLLSTQGVPNFFGDQRFGKAQQTLDSARAWLLGTDAAFDAGLRSLPGFLKKLYVSSVQSFVFNEVLRSRLEAGLFNKGMMGDVMRVEASGGLFWAESENDFIARVQKWDVSPTAPLPGTELGHRILPPQAAAKAFEVEAYRRCQMPPELNVGEPCALSARLKQIGSGLGAGTRRPIRIRPEALSLEQAHVDDALALKLKFELPKGAYATVVLDQLLLGEP